MLIKLTRTTHSKGLMGPLLVKLVVPQLQAMLIDPAKTLQLQADIAMQAFVSPIVLRMPQAAALQINAQGHPPGRKPTQPMLQLCADLRTPNAASPFEHGRSRVSRKGELQTPVQVQNIGNTIGSIHR